MYKACDHTNVIFEQEYKLDCIVPPNGTEQNESFENKVIENLFKLMQKYKTANGKNQINQDFCVDCCYETLTDHEPCRMTSRFVLFLFNVKNYFRHSFLSFKT